MAKAKTAEAQEKTKTADEAEAVVEKAEPQPEPEAEQPEEQTPPPPEFTDEENDAHAVAIDRLRSYVGLQMRRMSYTAPTDTLSIRDICGKLLAECDIFDNLTPKNAKDIIAAYNARDKAEAK